MRELSLLLARLSNTKESYKSYLKQQEIEMACVSIKYYSGTLKWWNTYTSLLWSMRTNQRWWLAQDCTLSSVAMSDTNWSLKERCTADDKSTVSAGVPVILLSWQDPSGSSRRKNCGSKTFGFFSNNLSLELGISSCFFHRSFYLFSEH